MASTLSRYPTDQFPKKWVPTFLWVFCIYVLAIIWGADREAIPPSDPPIEVFSIQMQHVILASTPPLSSPSHPQKKTQSKPTPKPALQPEAPLMDERVDDVMEMQPEDQVSHLESIEAPAGVSEVSSSIEQGVPQDSLNAMKSRYLAKLRRYVESAKFYPRLAKRLKQQGRVTIRFVIHKNGSIRQIEVKEKCPFAVLNQAAQESVGQLQSFDPIPEALAMDQWQIELPIVYSLQ